MENKRPLAHSLSCWLWTAAVSSAATLSGFAQNPEPGFETLFDGKSLTGWRTAGGRYEGTAEWSVVEGCIVGREGPDGAAGYLYTDRNYTSFDLRFEGFLEYPFDSGVFCRMTPKDQGDKKGAQITLDYRPNGQIGAVYSDGYLQENETGKAHYKRGDEQWRPKVRARVGHEIYPPSQDMIQWDDPDELGLADHMILWSRIDYLMARNDGLLGKLQRAFKKTALDPRTLLREAGAIDPFVSDFIQSAETTPAEFDEDWAKWVKKSYPKR